MASLPCRQCGASKVYAKEMCVRCYGRARHKAKPEKKHASNAKWYKANKDSDLARRLVRYKANPEKKRVSSAAWTKANKERVRANVIAWRKANPEKMIAYRQSRRALLLGAPGLGLEAMEAHWQSIKDLPCVCGSTGKMTLDHIIPLSKGGHHAPYNVQPLCGSCNSSKKGRDFAEWLASRRYEAA